MAIDKQKALEIARQTLAQDYGDDVVLLEDATVEKEFGWVFLSASSAFLQSGDPGQAIPGLGPLVVHKADGSTRFLGTSGPPEDGITIYEETWRRQQRGG